MGFFDKLTGTRHPDSGVTPVPFHDLRAALLALNGTGVPFGVRDAGAEGVDLLAEWRVMEPATGSGMSRRQVERTFDIWMRLVAGERVVRVLEEQRAVTRAGNPPGRVVQQEHSRGRIQWAHTDWTYERGPDGRRRRVVSFRADTRDMKGPLQKTVLGSGWTWRGVRTL
ncbi:hypothetical protein AB0953_11290 [Streptomyces sp. NPDC046866]|uniref:hypothetical protein n=1 Tax=Streptomyces sp. NPDC046866 TaxID=3154921 RepID=UPI0034549E75